MKVIVTGASGLIASELLSQLIKNTSITSIIILSRRPLEEIAARDPRIRVFVLKNFLEYEEEVVKELAGAKAVFWLVLVKCVVVGRETDEARALGGSNSKQTPSEKMDEVEVQYPLALANALISSRKAAKESESSEARLRFLFVSGEFSERDQSKCLWFLEQGRKARVSWRIRKNTHQLTHELTAYRA